MKCEAWKCDVGDSDAVKSTFKEIDEKFGNLHGVVANAGVSVVKDALEMTKEDYNYVCGSRLVHTKLNVSALNLETVDTNVYGQFLCAQAAAALWQEKQYKQGSIILTSSMSSQIVNKGIHQVWYNSSKAAASSIVKQLAVEVSLSLVAR